MDREGERRKSRAINKGEDERRNVKRKEEGACELITLAENESMRCRGRIEAFKYGEEE